MTTAESARKNVKKKRKKKCRRKRTNLPTLRFSPYAWAKLIYFRDKGATEVGAFGISRQKSLDVPEIECDSAREEMADENSLSKTDWNRVLSVDDIVFVKQRTTCVSVEFDDEAVADFYEDQVDEGREPREFSRVWIHTHPGESAEPSMTDEETFARCFGDCNWALMFILAKDGEFYARLQLRASASVTFLIPVEIDYSCEFRGTDREEWNREFQENVQPQIEWYDIEEEYLALLTWEEQELLEAYYGGTEVQREEVTAYDC